jgi:hypothetical protein
LVLGSPQVNITPGTVSFCIINVYKIIASGNIVVGEILAYVQSFLGLRGVILSGVFHVAPPLPERAR